MRVFMSDSLLLVGKSELNETLHFGTHNILIAAAWSEVIGRKGTKSHCYLSVMGTVEKHTLHCTPPHIPAMETGVRPASQECQIPPAMMGHRELTPVL
jgi:hypothetical protein